MNLAATLGVAATVLCSMGCKRAEPTIVTGPDAGPLPQASSSDVARNDRAACNAAGERYSARMDASERKCKTVADCQCVSICSSAVARFGAVDKPTADALRTIAEEIGQLGCPAARCGASICAAGCVEGRCENTGMRRIRVE
ncbi:MAG: hypothetical protein HY898_32895 [Deltaproteobacteria bacterium]|nr:hypothetical protein [Deltaproteobacteria bacterium]